MPILNLVATSLLVVLVAASAWFQIEDHIDAHIAGRS